MTQYGSTSKYYFGSQISLLHTKLTPLQLGWKLAVQKTVDPENEVFAIWRREERKKEREERYKEHKAKASIEGPRQPSVRDTSDEQQSEVALHVSSNDVKPKVDAALSPDPMSSEAAPNNVNEVAKENLKQEQDSIYVSPSPMELFRELAEISHLVPSARTAKDLIEWLNNLGNSVGWDSSVRDAGVVLDELLRYLDKRERIIFEKRVLPRPRITLEEIGRFFSPPLTRQRIAQIQEQAEVHISALVKTPYFSPLRLFTEDVISGLGSAIPKNRNLIKHRISLKSRISTLNQQHVDLMLYLSGYKQTTDIGAKEISSVFNQGHWLYRDDKVLPGRSFLKNNLEALTQTRRTRAFGAYVPLDDVKSLLLSAGIIEDVLETWLQADPSVHVNDNVVHIRNA